MAISAEAELQLFWCCRGPAKERRAASEAHYDVVVTREQGKNGEFTNLLEQEGLAVLEMPLVETTPGADR